jgi:predicted TIM-barrel fold metal-dependent hydrolase
MKDERFFKYTVSDGHVELDASCDLYRYMEVENFSGFKIYPALGYYPFDEQLLPLWRYAAERQIPIMTHCILGTIFYRGRKKKDWNGHPVFEEPKSLSRDDQARHVSVDEELGQDMDDDAPESDAFMKLNLHQLDNADFQRNFTHPLNYLCLLDDDLLCKTIQTYKNTKLEEVFGLKNDQIEYNLNDLKICLGHFGGDDEWKKYFELDRQNHVHQLMQKPMEGIDFFETNGERRRGKIAQLWREGVDWYSIICSLMLRYPNVYGDISYIVNNPDIFPLLKYTLRADNTRLRQRVLFGTDFYVVRNHKSEREMLVESQAWLTEEEFDLVARYNPLQYLATKRNTQGAHSEVA